MAWVTAVCAFAAWAAPACADESAWPTTQAKAYNFDFVPYLDPPAKPAAVCLVDSGVNVTPDTPADSPDGPIVKRLSVDGGSGLAANSTWEGLHGTRMAFVGVAPMNGWGAVGVWPGARIISIRAMPVDQTSFPFDNYSRAIELCRKRARSENIAAVNLALGCECIPTSVERARLDNEIVAAHANDESVVAAAGNNGGRVGAPATEAGVFAVAASDKTGVLCSFSNRGTGVAIVAPGCDIDLADPESGQLWSDYQSGTSGASVTTSVVLALVRSYRPDLGWQDAEQLVTSSAEPSTGSPLLNVETLFRSAGLGDLVDAARARMPASESSAPSDSGPSGGHDPLPETGAMGIHSQEDISSKAGGDIKRSFHAPRLRNLSRTRYLLTIAVRNRPHGVCLAVVVEQRRGEFGYAVILRAERFASKLTIPLPKKHIGPIRLRISFVKSNPAMNSPAISRLLHG